MNVWQYLEKHNLTDIVCVGIDRLNLTSDRVDEVMTQLERFLLVINYRAKSRFGQFSSRKVTIELTSEYFNKDWDSCKEAHHKTLLHEVAHLVVHFVCKGAGFHPRTIQAHGRQWQAVMRAFGLEPNRCSTSDVLKEARARKKKPPKHLYTCNKCGFEHGTQRELKNLERRYHGKCGGGLTHRRVG